MIRITIRQLEYFEALARLRHFGRAAQLVGVTQPALSAQIAELEQRLGTTLFIRGGRDIGLTEEALLLVPRIEKMLQELREIEAVTNSVRPAMSGRFRLGIMPTLAPYLLPAALPRLREDFPDLGLELREAVTDTLMEEVGSGRLDAVLVAAPVDGAGIVSMPLFMDRFLLAMPETGGDMPGAVPHLTPHLERLMLLEEGHCLREQALALCGQMRPAVRANLGATSLTTLMQMVAHGFGVTLVPEIAATALQSMPGVRIVPFVEPQPFRTIALAYPGYSSMAAECRAIGDVLASLFAVRSGSAGDQPPGDRRPQHA
ncbi:MAG: LysR substrate-binding domain-containing protein [Mesorhizobium sp.]